MNPQPSWTELEPYYSKGYDPYDPTHGAESEDDLEIEKARSTGFFRHIPVPSGKRLLDVGCGAGWFLRIAKKLGANEYGVEPSSYAASVARKQGLNVFNGTIEDFASSSNTKFDIITANHVIEHVPNPVETLRTMKRLLAPQGYIWIAVPNAAYPISRALSGRWHSSDLPYHLMHFTPGSIALAGREAGLILAKQFTESLPHIVEASIGQYLRYKWFLPRRLTQHTDLIRLMARWYARKADGDCNGEAVVSEFLAKP